MTRRDFLRLAGVVAGGAALAGCTTGSGEIAPTPSAHTTAAIRVPERQPADEFLAQVGDSLIALGEELIYRDGGKGLRFRSQIEDGRPHTDRDIGAAGVIMGFLALATKYPQDTHWLEAAKKASNWLRAVSVEDPESGGRYWPDYADDGDVSSDVYTSFDDGAAGIADAFWELYAVTHDERDKQTALDGLRWLLAQAQVTGKNHKGDRWAWNATDDGSAYYEGIGMGTAGEIYTLAKFYNRLKDSESQLAGQCMARLEGALNYLDSTRVALAREVADSTDAHAQAIPETDTAEGQEGNTAMNSGYLSGQAGVAFMYVALADANIFPKRKQEFLYKADSLYGWLDSVALVTVGNNAVAWRLSIDPKSGNDDHYATGVEEGNAGIGWSYLQAYGKTGDKRYLQRAEQAANWLIKVALRDKYGGFSWREDENPPSQLVHTNLNNGAAGNLVFFRDLYRATGIPAYKDAAQRALSWLQRTAQHDGQHIYWNDFGKGDNNAKPYSRDPSWHWGSAGILAAMAYSLDIPGEQRALRSPLLYRFK